MSMYPPVQRTMVGLLSRPRMSTYEQASGGDVPAAVDLYRWNLDISMALFEAIHYLEVAVRNRIDDALTQRAGAGVDWLDSPPTVPLNGGDEGQDRQGAGVRVPERQGAHARSRHRGDHVRFLAVPVRRQLQPHAVAARAEESISHGAADRAPRAAHGRERRATGSRTTSRCSAWTSLARTRGSSRSRSSSSRGWGGGSTRRRASTRCVAPIPASDAATGGLRRRHRPADHGVAVVLSARRQQPRARRVGRSGRTRQAGRASAAARAAAGNASRMRATAVSSWAAETNHASNTDGGRLTPASSIAWKNARYRNVSCAWACA